jgi:hypothetical protein
VQRSDSISYAVRSEGFPLAALRLSLDLAFDRTPDSIAPLAFARFTKMTCARLWRASTLPKAGAQCNGAGTFRSRPRLCVVKKRICAHYARFLAARSAGAQCNEATAFHMQSAARDSLAALRSSREARRPNKRSVAGGKSGPRAQGLARWRA